jgi:hypothetical protein
MSALPPKADISFYEHTDFRPSLIPIASATKCPDNPVFFRTSRPPKADIEGRQLDKCQKQTSAVHASCEIDRHRNPISDQTNRPFRGFVAEFRRSISSYRQFLGTPR